MELVGTMNCDNPGFLPFLKIWTSNHSSDMWLVSTYAIDEQAIDVHWAQWPADERLLCPIPNPEPTRKRFCKFHKRVTQRRKNSAPKFLDQIGMNWKAGGKLVQMSLEDVRKAFASRQCRILICRVT